MLHDEQVEMEVEVWGIISTYAGAENMKMNV